MAAGPTGAAGRRGQVVKAAGGVAAVAACPGSTGQPPGIPAAATGSAAAAGRDGVTLRTGSAHSAVAP
ncbi:hypothetical protein B1T46_29950 [Mycobacterium kansasii]|nr:hypothetical protein B1T46_29950 [Mycobacterium kansasii]